MGDTSQKQDRRSFSDKSEFLNQGDPLKLSSNLRQHKHQDEINKGETQAKHSGKQQRTYCNDYRKHKARISRR